MDCKLFAVTILTVTKVSVGQNISGTYKWLCFLVNLPQLYWNIFLLCKILKIFLFCFTPTCYTLRKYQSPKWNERRMQWRMLQLHDAWCNYYDMLVHRICIWIFSRFYLHIIIFKVSKLIKIKFINNLPIL